MSLGGPSAQIQSGCSRSSLPPVEVYARFYNQFGEQSFAPGGEFARFCGLVTSRVVQFDVPYSRALHISVFGSRGSSYQGSALYRFTPEGEPYSHLRYDSRTFSLVTTDGTTTRVWRPQYAEGIYYGPLDAVHHYDPANERLLLDFISTDGTTVRADISRAEGTGTIVFDKERLGWILDAASSYQEQARILDGDINAQNPAA